MDIIIVSIAAAVGWALAGTFFGLWRGECGRRLDLTWLVNREARPAENEAVVYRTSHPDEEAFREAEIEDLAATIRDLSAEEGRPVGMEEARKDALEMLEQRSARLEEVP